MRIALLCLAGLAACGAPATTPESVPVPEIKSTDFAILPCGANKADCVEVRAGGKRLVFGAGSGVADALSAETLAEMEAVFLFSMRYPEVQGLDELRNQSWLAGRDQPLRVAGPDGIRQLVGGLNAAFEVSDALAFVNDRPSGGFDAAFLTPLPGDGQTQTRVFTTGDLDVTKMETPHGMAAYQIDYVGHVAWLVPCDWDTLAGFDPGNGFVLTCSVENGGWPLTEPHFVYRD